MPLAEQVPSQRSCKKTHTFAEPDSFLAGLQLPGGPTASWRAYSFPESQVAPRNKIDTVCDRTLYSGPHLRDF
jgi:hypothetical protein